MGEGASIDGDFMKHVTGRNSEGRLSKRRYGILIVEAIGSNVNSFEEGVGMQGEDADMGVAMLLDDKTIHEGVMQEFSSVGWNNDRVFGELYIAHPQTCVNNYTTAIVFCSHAAT